MNYKEFEIGETFEFEGRTFVVEKACVGCFFNDLDGCIFKDLDNSSTKYEEIPLCRNRYDGEQVVFNEVKPK